MKRDPLPELLGTLDKSEKRYLGLFLERSAGHATHSKRLYDLLVRKGFSVAAAKAEVKDEPLFAVFEVAKNQLYHQLLEGLQQYHAGKSDDAFLYNGMQQLQILFQKKMVYQAGLLRKKLQQRAEARNKPALVIELLSWEMRLLQAGAQLDVLEQRAPVNYKKQRELLGEQQLLLHLQQLTYQHHIAVKRNWVGDMNRKLEKEFKKLNPAEMKSVNSRILYHQLQSTFYFSIGRPEKAMEGLLQQKKLFAQHPDARQTFQHQYVALLNNLNVILMEQGKYDEVLEHVKLLKAIQPGSPEKQLRIIERVVNAELNIHRIRGNSEAGKALLREYAPLFEKQQFSPVYQMLYALEAAVLHFTIEEYRTALRFLNKLLLHAPEGLRNDIRKASVAMRWLTWYETGKEDLLEKTLREEEHNTDPFQLALLRLLRKLIYGGKVRPALEAWVTELQELRKNAAIREAYFYTFDFITWARCKAQGVSFAARIQKQN